jgi:phosphoribosylanthranilate isomerase
VFVKICGITTPDDALLAAGLGADAVGLIFAPSTRKVTAATAVDIVRRLPPEVLTVGVFRNERRERVVTRVNEVGLRVAQLHGDETADDVAWIAERVPNVIRALSAADLARHDLDALGSARLLIDAPEPGSGSPFDWERLAADPPRQAFLLAGGLHPGNVVDAITLLRPWGVDVATGVEARPGVKDPVKVQRFIAAARSVARSDDLDGPIAGSPFDWEDAAPWP